MTILSLLSIFRSLCFDMNLYKCVEYFMLQLHATVSLFVRFHLNSPFYGLWSFSFADIILSSTLSPEEKEEKEERDGVDRYSVTNSCSFMFYRYIIKIH